MAKLKLGPEFAQLEAMLKARVEAVKQNESALKAEIAAHDGSHAFGRHGAQTGWENQIVRAATGITPDQAFDRTGVTPSIRSWSADGYSTVSSLDALGERQHGPMSLAHYPAAAEYRTGGGDVAGGFYSPEAHQQAISSAAAQLNAVSDANHYAARFKDTTSGKFGWFPITTALVCVGSTGGKFFGLGFARRDPKSYRAHSREFVLRMIEAYQTGKTGTQACPKLDASVHKFNYIALRKTKPLFTSMQELTDYFDLDVITQPSALVVYRRTFDRTAKAYGAWRRVTMYPDNGTPGWAPQLPRAFEQAEKNEMQAKGMSRETGKYTWTGDVADRSGTNKRTYLVPPWA